MNTKIPQSVNLDKYVIYSRLGFLQLPQKHGGPFAFVPLSQDATQLSAIDAHEAARHFLGAEVIPAGGDK